MPERDYHKFDITIIGAGPCGSVLAYELARRNYRVLVLEKERLPRPKVCAGGITVRAAQLVPFDFSQVVEQVVYSVRLSYNLEFKRLRSCDQPLAYMVKREKFDHFLAAQARQKGAFIEEESGVQRVEFEDQKVRIVTPKTSFLTPLVVGADGANSVVVKSLGWRHHYEFGACLCGHIPAEQDILSQWDATLGLDMGIPGGYAWLFPKSGGINIGAGGTLKDTLKLKPYLARLMQVHGLGLLEDHALKGHLMPIRKPGFPLTSHRALLVGDAAGVIDPLSGEGIYYGLKSVYLALPVIIRFLEGKSRDLAEYDASMEREIFSELKIARSVEHLNSITPWIFFTLLSRNTRFWRAFCGMLRSERTYAGIKKSVPWPLRWLFRVL